MYVYGTWIACKKCLHSLQRTGRAPFHSLPTNSRLRPVLLQFTWLLYRWHDVENFLPLIHCPWVPKMWQQIWQRILLPWRVQGPQFCNYRWIGAKCFKQSEVRRLLWSNGVLFLGNQMSLYFVQKLTRKDLQIPVDLLDKALAHLLLFVSRFPGGCLLWPILIAWIDWFLRVLCLLNFHPRWIHTVTDPFLMLFWLPFKLQHWQERLLVWRVGVIGAMLVGTWQLGKNTQKFHTNHGSTTDVNLRHKPCCIYGYNDCDCWK